ncbi:MAG: hypothetical protein J0L84_07300 [Verrucomicrobia bacterium]|nr:hypothetical protein [Verrucomicrobiota bacterium]
MSPRTRTLALTAASILAVWMLALGGFAWARHSKITPDRVTAYLASLDFRNLPPAERLRALRKLAAWLNALSPEERRRVRRDPAWAAWLQSMDDAEKGELLELTLPTGFGQMLTAFEQLPEDQRRKTVEETLRRLREDREAAESDGSPAPGSEAELSPELREKMVTLGVKSFMEQGSPETKAQLQPVLEEMQRAMESGRLFRPPRRPRIP